MMQINLLMRKLYEMAGHVLYFFSPMLTRTKHNYFSLYFTGMAFQIERPA